jgi:hypothetical protein
MNEGDRLRDNGKAARKAGQVRRLSAALRENLKRRKAQARAKAQGQDADQTPANSAPSGENPAGDAKAPDFRRNRGSD